MIVKDVLFALPGILMTVVCWGTYGSVLHKGQGALAGDRLKPLICVGLAYVIIAIIVPVVILAMSGKLGPDWTFVGVSWSMAAGACGALGALGLVLALTSGGKPIYVMPLVFGGAPIVNVFVSMYFARLSVHDVHPVFYAGMIMVGVGAAVVLIFQPRTHHAPPTAKPGAESHAAAPKENPQAPEEPEKPA